MENIEKVYQDIKDLKIQGATNIAIAILETLSKYSQEEKSLDKIKKAGDLLLTARPTEPLAQNAVKYVLTDSRDSNKIEEKAQAFLELIKNNNKKIIEAGISLIEPGDHILTHCHSSTVIKIFTSGAPGKSNVKFYNTPTRPKLQGRETSEDLLEAGLDVTMITDLAAPFALSPLSDEDIRIDKVFLGADVVFSEGLAVNKIGSFGISETAKKYNIPVYIAANLLKTDDDSQIRMEKRRATEVWKDAPEGLKIINLAFDIVPAENITAFITEFGLVKPEEIRDITNKNYPWIFKK